MRIETKADSYHIVSHQSKEGLKEMPDNRNKLDSAEKFLKSIKTSKKV
jgi:hypothetical protein